MDHQRDFDNFRKLIGRLCSTMDKFMTDELVESWWKALRTVSFPEVERRVDAFIARASDGTKFPRPGMFRPDDAPVAADPREDAREQRMTEHNRRCWDDFIREFPVTGPLRLKLAQCSRIMMTSHESTPQYAEALADYRWSEKQLGPDGRFSADR